MLGRCASRSPPHSPAEAKPPAWGGPASRSPELTAFLDGVRLAAIPSVLNLHRENGMRAAFPYLSLISAAVALRDVRSLIRTGKTPSGIWEWHVSVYIPSSSLPVCSSTGVTEIDRRERLQRYLMQTPRSYRHVAHRCLFGWDGPRQCKAYPFFVRAPSIVILPTQFQHLPHVAGGT